MTLVPVGEGITELHVDWSNNYDDVVLGPTSILTLLLFGSAGVGFSWWVARPTHGTCVCLWSPLGRGGNICYLCKARRRLEGLAEGGTVKRRQCQRHRVYVILWLSVWFSLWRSSSSPPPPQPSPIWSSVFCYEPKVVKGKRRAGSGGHGRAATSAAGEVVPPVLPELRALPAQRGRRRCNPESLLDR
ncbi:hypothetical protein BHM03_00009663 [Ensete ventricosum]|nr:hypothetical protein BHM03_00009663 [Ensete ventricosum]